MSSGENNGRRIVCAANRFLVDGEEILIISARHWDKRMREQATVYCKMYPNMEDEIYTSEEGFIDTWGKFHNRKTAYKIAKYHNQIIRSVGYETDELYSEHLY